jgi:glycerol-3-phosphate O-acyltransferase
MNMKIVRTFGWFMHKFFRSIYEKIIVDQVGLEKIKALSKNTACPIVFCPTHKSYIDFLIISYIFFASGLKVPFIAAGTYQIIFINSLTRH